MVSIVREPSTLNPKDNVCFFVFWIFILFDEPRTKCASKFQGNSQVLGSFLKRKSSTYYTCFEFRSHENPAFLGLDFST